MGILGYINDFIARDFNFFHASVDQTILNMFFNCKESSISGVLAKPVSSNFAEVSFMQNLLDQFGISEDLELQVQDILSQDRMKQYIEGIVDPEDVP